MQVIPIGNLKCGSQVVIKPLSFFTVDIFKSKKFFLAWKMLLGRRHELWTLYYLPSSDVIPLSPCNPSSYFRKFCWAQCSCSVCTGSPGRSWHNLKTQKVWVHFKICQLVETCRSTKTFEITSYTCNAILGLKPLKIVTELKSLSGLCNPFRGLDPNFARVGATPSKKL